MGESFECVWGDVGRGLAFAATLTSSLGAHRSGGSFRFSSLGPYMFSNLNSGGKVEGREKRKREKKKKRLLHGINMLYVPLSHAISLHRCAGIFIPSRNV